MSRLWAACAAVSGWSALGSETQQGELGCCGRALEGHFGTQCPFLSFLLLWPWADVLWHRPPIVVSSLPQTPNRKATDRMTSLTLKQNESLDLSNHLFVSGIIQALENWFVAWSKLIYLWLSYKSSKYIWYSGSKVFSFMLWEFLFISLEGYWTKSDLGLFDQLSIVIHEV